jgi:hypothetical protein
MSKSTQMTLAQLQKVAGPEVEQLLREVADAINQAPDGAVIAGSEEAVRDAMARFRQRVYELGLQLRTDAAKAAFPPLRPVRTVQGCGIRKRPTIRGRPTSLSRGCSARNAPMTRRGRLSRWP